MFSNKHNKKNLVSEQKQQQQEQQRKQQQQQKQMEKDLQQKIQQQQQQNEMKAVGKQEDDSQILQHPLVQAEVNQEIQQYLKKLQKLQQRIRTLELQLQQFEEQKEEPTKPISNYNKEIQSLQHKCQQLQEEISQLRKGQQKDPYRIRIIDDNELKDKVKKAEGGFGEIFQANYKNQLCSVKSFKITSFDQNQQEVNNLPYFLQEIINNSLIVQEAHPNISRTLACGLEIRIKENPAFIVSEWVVEGDLGQFVNNKKLQTFLEQFSSTSVQHKQLLQFSAEIVEAIDFLHSRGLTHCDLKPQNIFVRQEAQNRISPVIADFGISVVMGNQTRQGTQILGFSERWMPYEYICDETISPKTDVWSLGCLIFYLFSRGHLPWSKCKKGADIILRIGQKSDLFGWVEQQTINDVAPIRQILDQCLAHDHTERASVQQLRDLLRNELQIY